MKGLTIGLLFITTICLGQVSTLSDEKFNGTAASRLIFVENETEAIESAQFDIEKGTPILLLQGGISPIVYGTDRDFEKKFKVYFYDWGCVGPDEKISAVYNFETFEYLRKRFGTNWMKTIRKDVIGLREWRKSRGK